jgi:hypothetical protein
MTEIVPPETPMPCHQIPSVTLQGERRQFDRVEGQTPFSTFNNWAHHEARRLCERGGCATGRCRGHVDVSDWKLVDGDDQGFSCEFSAEFYCRCE